jgi:Flp pilus assembly protein TadG
MSRRRSGRRGQAIVETVLILPFLVLVLFGIISFGLYINAINTVEQAARDGARTAVIGDSMGCPGDSATAQLAEGSQPTVYGAVDSQINNDNPWLTTNSSTGPKPVISYAAVVGNETNPQQTEVVITVAYPYKPLLPIPGILPGSVVIASTYQMMVQVPQAQPGATQPTLPSGPPYYETTQYTNPVPSGNAVYLVQPGGCP